MRGRLVFTMAVLVLLAVVAFFFFGRQWIAAYDEDHPVTLDCVISNAKASAVSTHSGRGVGSYTDQVDLHTSNCGHLVIRDGITSENSDAVASTFERGKTYRITLGEASLALRAPLSVLGAVPEVRGWERG
ncbi:hypothetical protein C1N91_14600 [Curtobacterium sp. SGAir0471]|uniref:hypothetical protein n=1 Tax=Curtobacterium sp. SGAir0471 TaxID=2070337 RepID=UPI0010CCDD20|nr:hypothetical protein [Curtobacterium sp. SGAir0471]QCR44568.1 hypothetical protein C1N91_14600 [Curtobacterium sp. SGAir0471]